MVSVSWSVPEGPAVVKEIGGKKSEQCYDRNTMLHEEKACEYYRYEYSSKMAVVVLTLVSNAQTIGGLQVAGGARGIRRSGGGGT
jgi:hypothetical protein